MTILTRFDKMSAVKVKLRFEGIQTLIKELTESQMLAFYFMGLGNEMPERVTKFDLTGIIQVLCKKLNWIEEQEEGNKLGKYVPKIKLETRQKEESIWTEELEIFEDFEVDTTQNDEARENSGTSIASDKTHASPKSSVAVGEISTTIVSKKFGCSTCNKKFNMTDDLRRHERTHTGDKPFSCKQCAFKSSHIGNLKRHERTHTGDKVFSCSHCDFRSSRSDKLKVHEKIHTSDKPFGCKQCDFKSSHVGNLKRHERTHTGDKVFSCSHCDFRSSRSDKLKVHEKIHTGDKPYKKKQEQKRQSKNILTKPTTNNGNSNLAEDLDPLDESHEASDNQDKDTDETEGKPLKIEVDESIWMEELKYFEDSKDNTTSNDALTPLLDKNFSCSDCTYICSKLELMKRHKRIHTGDKPFSCLKCDFKSSHVFNLKRHERTHTGEKAFSCSHCGFRSSRSDKLKVHEKIHTGDKPFKKKQEKKRQSNINISTKPTNNGNCN